jgi:hypothetical protein
MHTVLNGNLGELMTNLILNELCTPILQFTFVK